MSDALLLLARINLAAGAAVVLVMLLRRPARRLFGAGVAYGLWALVPLFAAAMLAPARVVRLTQPVRRTGAFVQDGAAPTTASHVRSAFDGSHLALAVWIAGAAAALAYLAWRQAQFGRAMRAGRAGPAVVGVVRPRIVVPDDFAQRYTPREQQVVLAHEATHIARQDPRINALVSLARCVGWFNPLAHLMARELRIDQELACDAQVVAAHPTARRSYAEAMLKTQLAGRPLPLGCYWPAQSAHPLAERIALLSRRAPGRADRALGVTMVMLLAFGGACGVWATRPPQIVLIAPAAPSRASTPGPGAQPQVQIAAAPALRPPARPPALEPVSLREASAQAEPPALALTPVGLTEATDDPALAGPERRLLPPGSFGPSKIRGIANWSSVEPGLAVRVLATMTDPDGVPLTTDLTSFGSQSRYRLGYVERNSSRFKLFTRVVQHGERLLVTAGLNRPFTPMLSGTVELTSGETGTIRLPTGQLVTVTPTVRPETPDEVAEGQGRARIEVLQGPQPS
jgi:beta-lactamase regulating signal transducer with metallopeptidase domain